MASLGLWFGASKYIEGYVCGSLGIEESHMEVLGRRGLSLTLYLCVIRHSLYVHKFKLALFGNKCIFLKKIFVLLSLMVFSKYIPISNRPFLSNDLS